MIPAGGGALSVLLKGAERPGCIVDIRERASEADASGAFLNSLFVEQIINQI